MTAPWIGLLFVLAVIALGSLCAFFIQRTPEQQAADDLEQMEALRRGYEEHG